jgi:thiamine pyrophosphokinase
MSLVVVLAGGPGLPVGFEVPDGATVIAADGGAELGVRVDLGIGDFDSITSETLAALPAVEAYPPEKDATDLELALDAALRSSPTHVLVVGSAGGRLDHLFGSLLLLADARYEGVVLDALLGEASVHVVRGTRELEGEVGELISLFAVHGRAEGVTSAGLVYPLHGETLEPGSSRGTSNAFAAAVARVTVGRGVVLAVRPG